MFGDIDFPIKQVEKGDLLFKEGSELKSLFVIKSGEVSCISLSSGKYIPIHKVSETGIIGEDCLFLSPSNAYYSAVAMTRVRYMEIPKKDILKYVNEASPWIKNIMTDISDKIHKTTDVLKEHKIIDDRLNGGNLITPEEDKFFKESLSK